MTRFQRDVEREREAWQGFAGTEWRHAGSIHAKNIVSNSTIVKDSYDDLMRFIDNNCHTDWVEAEVYEKLLRKWVAMEVGIIYFLRSFLEAYVV